MSSDVVNAIQNGLNAFASKELYSELTASGPVLAQTLSRYLQILSRWNAVHNLTAVRDPHQMVTHHILDSLAILPWVVGDTVLDVGSGAGLPGIPLAAARPRQNFTLLDAQIKKVSFMRHAAAKLGLTNVSVAHARVEDFSVEAPFQCVVSRAFSDTADFVNRAGHLCAPHGELLAMKGVFPHSEREHIPMGWKIKDIAQLAVPGLDATRHLVVISRTP